MPHEELLGAAETDAEEVVLGAASGDTAYGGTQLGGRHPVAGGVLGDGQRLEGVAGEGVEHGVPVGSDVGAGPAQGDEQFVHGGAGLDLQEGIAQAGGACDAAHGGPGDAVSARGTTGRSGSM